MLTIGDGLVSQIPALLISTAAGVLVTKDSSDVGLGPNLARQLGQRPKATLIAAATMAARISPLSPAGNSVAIK